MTRKSALRVALIGPGLYAQVRRPESIFEYYRRLQKTCEHAKRDPKGICYRCGDPRPIFAHEEES